MVDVGMGRYGGRRHWTTATLSALILAVLLILYPTPTFLQAASGGGAARASGPPSLTTVTTSAVAPATAPPAVTRTATAAETRSRTAPVPVAPATATTPTPTATAAAPPATTAVTEPAASPSPAPVTAAPAPTTTSTGAALVAALVAEAEADGIDPGPNWRWSMGNTAALCGSIPDAGIATGCTSGAAGAAVTVFSGSPTLALVAHELANAETENDAVPSLVAAVTAAEAGTSWSPIDAVASCLVEHFMGFQDHAAGTWKCPDDLAATVAADIHDPASTVIEHPSS